jgi:hypothetical protein
MWEVWVTDEFEEWYDLLAQDDQEKIRAAVALLAEQGPNLKRPAVGEVAGSTIHNLKELIPSASPIRILFCFDPRRSAILLTGGDKSQHGWQDWYPDAIAEAERLYGEYIDRLKKEGEIS